MEYFMSFTFKQPNGVHGEGNGSFHRTTPITCIKDIRKVEKSLVNTGTFEWVNITTWRRFEEE